MFNKERLAGSLLFLSWVVLSGTASAAPSLGKLHTIQQPDGNQFRAIQKGDEWSNHVENGRGYTVSRSADGIWRYVRGYGADNSPQIDPTPAHRPPPPGLQKHLSPSSSRPSRAPGSGSSAPALAAISPAPASAPVLFILAEFGNRAGNTSVASWGNLISDNVQDYFLETSHGATTLTPAIESSGDADDGVIGWLNLGLIDPDYNQHPDTYHQVDSRNRDLAEAAINAADSSIDYSSYDTNGDNVIDGYELSIVVIVAGYETAYGGTLCTPHPSVWGHKWGWDDPDKPLVDGVSISSYAQFGERHGAGGICGPLDFQASMGIIVHELGHLTFDLPDLYDTDGSSSGIGGFGLMGYGSWGWTLSDLFTPDGHEGSTPVNVSAWSKVQMGWATPQDGGGIETIVASGDVSANSTNTVFRASTSGASTEYFLVENRQEVGYDAGLAGILSSTEFVTFGGLAIWHIDETQPDNTNDLNRLVDFEEADGTDMEDVDFHQGHPEALWFAPDAAVFNDTSVPSSDLSGGGSSGVDINNISTSSPSMTASFTETPPPAAMHVGDLDSSGVSAPKGKWDAVVTVTILDDLGDPVPNATVSGQWSNGTNGGAACASTTNASGECVITKNNLKNNVGDVTLTISDVTHASNTYSDGDNADPDGDSDGTVIVVYKPGTEPPPPPVDLDVHIADLDGSSSPAPKGGKWNASVTVTVHDHTHAVISAGVTVEGLWSNGVSGTGSCVTVGGVCSIDKNNIKNNAGNDVTFEVTDIIGVTTYSSGFNHDDDLDSTGTVITVTKP